MGLLKSFFDLMPVAESFLFAKGVLQRIRMKYKNSDLNSNLIFKRGILLVLILVLSGPKLFENFLRFDTFENDFKLKNPTQKKISDYWKEVQLDENLFLKLINPSQCDKNEQSKKACKMAWYQLNKVCEISDSGFNIDSKIGIEKVEILLLEKSQSLDLAYNSKLFNKSNVQSLIKTCSDPQMALAQSVNAFLSIQKDPHSYIVPLRYYEEVMSQGEVSMNGFGFFIRRNIFLEWAIAKVIPHSPASLAGIQSGDLITTLQNKPIFLYTPKEIHNIFQSSNSLEIEVSRYNKVKLIKKFNVILKPEHFSVQNVSSRWINEEKKVGLIKIDKFAQNTCRDFRTQLLILKTENLKGLILDLRDNPGGSVDEASCVMGYFLPRNQKLFFTFDIISGAIDTYTANTDQLFSGGLAILVNEGSASASEIVAGGLKALKRASLVGRRTFGKGTYQDGIIWPYQPQIAYFETRGYYVFLDGKTAQLEGVTPDIIVNHEESYKAQWMREEDIYAYPLPSAPMDNRGILSKFLNRTHSELEFFKSGFEFVPKLISIGVNSENCLTSFQSGSGAVELALEYLVCEDKS